MPVENVAITIARTATEITMMVNTSPLDVAAPDFRMHFASGGSLLMADQQRNTT
nr:hypothetical protein Iba_scaffold7681CG0030 [Ipomoea batatas]